MIYDIAGLRIDIRNKFRYTDGFCQAYLSQDQTAPVDLIATVSEEDFQREKTVSSQFPDGYIENICLYRSICNQLPVLNRMLLHAAVLEYEGNAYAFLGKSGTGKSTHTGLWLKALNGVKIVNGDKPILWETEGEIFACGTPWMGKEGLGMNAISPLKGLCFLEQAKENFIRRLTPSEAAMKTFAQILIPNDGDNTARTLEFTDRIVSKIPCYLLRCNISEEAVKTSFEALTGENYISKINNQ